MTSGLEDGVDDRATSGPSTIPERSDTGHSKNGQGRAFSEE